MTEGRWKTTTSIGRACKSSDGLSGPLLIGREAWPFFQLHLIEGRGRGPPPSLLRRGSCCRPDCALSFVFRAGGPGPDFPGGHGGEATPIPIPNTEVKGPIAEGTAGFACGRVGRRRGLIAGAAGRKTRGPFFFGRAA